MKIFAHRGYSGKYPENTLLAFEKALETGCYGIELDVHLTQDGKLVILHDETVDRTTNGSGSVHNLTLDAIKLLDAGHGQTIPTLDEYLDLTAGSDIVTNIELKTDVVEYPLLEEKVVETVQKRRLEHRVILSSFNHRSVLKAKQAAPQIPCAFLCGTPFNVTEIARKMHESGVEYLHPYLNLLTAQTLQDIAFWRLPIHVWTVDRPKDAQWLAAAGTAGIFTNQPEQLAAYAAPSST